MTYPLTLVFIWLVFLRPQEWLIPDMYGIPVLQIITVLSMFGLAMGINQGADRIPKTPAVFLAIGLWVATLFSHISHFYFQGVLNTYQETFKISLLLVLLLVVINSVQRARGVVLIFVISALVMSVHALMQQKTGYGFAGQPPLWVPDLDNGGWKSRSQYFGIFEDPNDLAQILAGTIPLIFAYPRRLSAVNLIIACGAAWVVIQALYSTGSRGGQVALFASIATMVMLKLPKKWLPYSIGVGLIGALVLCAVYGGSMMDASARERLEFWGLANQVFKHNPIFGIGYGMFWEVAGDRTAHSAFVYCYTELGIFGYWFWFSLLQLGLIGCYRTRMAFFRPRNEAEKYMKRLSGLCIASMVGFSAGAYFLSRAYTFPYFFLFGLLNAIPVIALRMLPEDRPPLIDTADDVYGRGTISTFISIVYIYVSILILNRFK